TCPERVCSGCGTPWTPVHDSQPVQACPCSAGWRPGLVLDPFMGAGTVALAAERHGRDWLGIELNPAYRDLALQPLASRSSTTPAPGPRARGARGAPPPESPAPPTPGDPPPRTPRHASTWPASPTTTPGSSTARGSTSPTTSTWFRPGSKPCSTPARPARRR